MSEGKRRLRAERHRWTDSLCTPEEAARPVVITAARRRVGAVRRRIEVMQEAICLRDAALMEVWDHE
jgi:hypothetical protein